MGEIREGNESYALVTGAAGGLGRAFAEELAGRGYDTILTDLPGTGLPQLCSDITAQYGTRAIYYETDLTDIDNVITVAKDINSRYNLFLLINNAGVGGTRRFGDASIDYINNIVQLNVMAPTILTKMVLPNLQRQQRSYILNVSSMAAFTPIAFKTAYPASKAYIHYFTMGLGEEYRRSNISISVVYPGPMKTNPEITERIKRHGFFGKVGLLSPGRVASLSIRQLFNRTPLIMLDGNRLTWFVMKLLPMRIRLSLFSRAVKRELRKKSDSDE